MAGLPLLFLSRDRITARYRQRWRQLECARSDFSLYELMLRTHPLSRTEYSEVSSRLEPLQQRISALFVEVEGLRRRLMR